jgi:hypothetical protein
MKIASVAASSKSSLAGARLLCARRSDGAPPNGGHPDEVLWAFRGCYGTIWLLVLGLSVITQSHINAGAFGLFGFPIIALVYAGIRIGADPPSEVPWLRRRVAELEQEIARRSLGDS